ncbi:MAG: NFACT family protein, partial [Clostridia bacterium]|nr:NFACT family protein [Clostridia bacterium]
GRTGYAYKHDLRGFMALDGITLGLIKNELKDYIIGSKIDKVHQPSKNELVLILRTRNGGYRLYLSCDGQSHRVHLSRYNLENPKVPPMLCMLLRKRLCGATLSDISQISNDRIIIFEFDGTTEIGDKTKYYLICEIMGQRSNIILCDADYKIIDAVKRIDEDKSSVREILPGLKYDLPPMQEKCDIISDSEMDIVNRILLSPEKMLSKAVLESVEGFSPIIGREIAYRTVFGDKQVGMLSEIEKERLENEINIIKEEINNKSFYMLTSVDGVPFDFSFSNVRQYGTTLNKKQYDSISELLDDFYFEKDKINRTKRKASDLFKILNSAVERTSRKINNRRLELEKSENREQLRIYAELITANQYRLTEKSSVYTVENYYDNCNSVDIPVNPALSAQQNAQKYFKEYKKAANAEKLLHNLIEDGEQELIYLDTVLDNLARAVSDREITEIREELEKGGYVKVKKGNKQKKEKPLPPIEFKSSDGFTILVGRNNVQNDTLTLKTAKNYDMWLHVQKHAGSHTVIIADKKEITETVIFEAACIAAYHSKAKDSSSVAVDYTLIKNVKKPEGEKAGKVIYNTYNTVYVTPQKELVEKPKISE